MSRIFEYFVVCGIGPEIRTMDGSKGYHGTGCMYLPSLLDQYPPLNHSLYPPPPPQLSTCVLPAGVEFHSLGFDSNDPASFPRSYPIVLTEGDGSKIYVSCISFRDPVCEDIAEAYRIRANSYADKCICLVSRLPSFSVLRNALEEIFSLCFSKNGSSKPLWDVIEHMVSSVPLPTPGKERVLFAIENCLLSVEAPPSDWLPHADISFQPLVQCLDVDNLVTLFTAVLLERRILLRANKYSLLTLASEAICHLIYPFRWQHVYIPLLFFSGVDYIDAPTPYMMGLYSGVDTSALAMDGVVVVDLEYNRITTSEEIPPIPEPEFSLLRGEIMQLIHPNVIGIDEMKAGIYRVSEHYPKLRAKQWGEEHDLQLRMIFLKFFATVLSGYRNFLENSATQVFNTQAFLKKRSRSTNQPPEPMIAQFLDSHGFLDYLERGVGSDENNNNLLDKLQDAIGRGQNPMSILPSSSVEPEILTVSDSDVGISGSGAKYTYDRFPANIRTEEQEEKRKQILAAVSNAFEYSGRHTPSKDPLADTLSPLERAAERERMVLDIKVKLQGLWLRLLKLGATDDPLSSFEYGTILALIESDAEGIGGSGFVECISEHIHSGWDCHLTEEQFIAVKELLKTAINRATSRNDLLTIRDALEVSSDMYKKDSNNVPDYVQRHLISLSIWEELRFWEGYFDYLMEQSSNKSANYASLVTAQLVVLASHMAGLGLPDNDAWYMIETIAERNSIGSKQFIKIRGFLSHIQQLCNGYWGITSMKAQSVLSHSLSSPHSKDAIDENQQPTEATGVGRNWVQSMFSRNTTIRSSSFSRVRRWTSDGGNSATNENGTPRKQDLSSGGQKKLQTNVRILRGHNGAITALHCVTKREVWDLVGDREDAGFFISGSTDCSVKIWDPSLRGSELRATLKGHFRTVRAISSDRGKVVSGSDDQSVLVWDKQTTQLLEELKGHDGPVSCVRMLSGERVLTASHDGTVKMWDVRTDRCVATVGRCSSAVLCMEYDDNVGVLAAGGRDVVANIWDIRSSRQMHKLSGHTQWIRSIRMVGDTVITGSDDWTARIWSVSRGTCDAVLACHAGPILCVEYSSLDRGIITGSTDDLLRFWENEDGGIRCAKNVTIHNAAILSINAGEHWLGIGAADNSLSLFHRPQERLDGFSGTGSKMGGWQLYRTPQKTVAMNEMVSKAKEEVRSLRHVKEDLLKQVEGLQMNRFSEVEELVYLRWVNACLRYELKNYQAPPGKLSARDLNTSLSPKSQEKAKQLMLEYAGSEHGQVDTDLDSYFSHSSSPGSEDLDNTSIDSSTSKHSNLGKKTTLIQKLKKWGKSKDDSSALSSPARYLSGGSPSRMSLSNRPRDSLESLMQRNAGDTVVGVAATFGQKDQEPTDSLETLALPNIRRVSSSDSLNSVAASFQLMSKTVVGSLDEKYPAYKDRHKLALAREKQTKEMAEKARVQKFGDNSNLSMISADRERSISLPPKLTQLKEKAYVSGGPNDDLDKARNVDNQTISKMKVAYIEKRPPRVPQPPPKPSDGALVCTNSNPSNAASCALSVPPPPTPPELPPGSLSRGALADGKVHRAPELVEFYQTLMKREAKKDTSLISSTTFTADARSNMIGEIEHRSSFLLAVKADVETQGDFVMSLATEVRAASFSKIEDLVAFVNWLDEELSFLVDERAVLKHFDWPEGKADALREAAFEYLDLMKLEKQVSTFTDDPNLLCEAALEKMYSLLEKVEQSIFALLRTRDMAMSRYTEFGIPVNWLLDTGVVGKIKLSSVQLANKYMKRVASELDLLSKPEKEPTREFFILQGVRFAFRVHQFAGGFDTESMKAFEELRSCIHATACEDK